MQISPAASTNGERPRQRYVNIRVEGGGDIQILWRNGWSYANQTDERAGLCKYLRCEGGVMQILPARLGQAVGSARLRGQHRDRDREPHRTAAGPHRGRAGSAATPGTCGRAGGSYRGGRAAVQVRIPGWGAGSRAHRDAAALRCCRYRGAGKWRPRTLRPVRLPRRGSSPRREAPRIAPAAPSGRASWGSGTSPGEVSVRPVRRPADWSGHGGAPAPAPPSRDGGL